MMQSSPGRSMRPSSDAARAVRRGTNRIRLLKDFNSKLKANVGSSGSPSTTFSKSFQGLPGAKGSPAKTPAKKPSPFKHGGSERGSSKTNSLLVGDGASSATPPTTHKPGLASSLMSGPTNSPLRTRKTFLAATDSPNMTPSTSTPNSNTPNSSSTKATAVATTYGASAIISTGVSLPSAGPQSQQQSATPTAPLSTPIATPPPQSSSPATLVGATASAGRSTSPSTILPAVGVSAVLDRALPRRLSPLTASPIRSPGPPRASLVRSDAPSSLASFAASPAKEPPASGGRKTSPRARNTSIATPTKDVNPTSLADGHKPTPPPLDRRTPPSSPRATKGRSRSAQVPNSARLDCTPMRPRRITAPAGTATLDETNSVVNSLLHADFKEMALWTSDQLVMEHSMYAKRVQVSGLASISDMDLRRWKYALAKVEAATGYPVRAGLTPAVTRAMGLCPPQVTDMASRQMMFRLGMLALQPGLARMEEARHRERLRMQAVTGARLLDGRGSDGKLQYQDLHTGYQLSIPEYEARYMADVEASRHAVDRATKAVDALRPPCSPSSTGSTSSTDTGEEECGDTSRSNWWNRPLLSPTLLGSHPEVLAFTEEPPPSTTAGSEIGEDADQDFENMDANPTIDDLSKSCAAMVLEQVQRLQLQSDSPNPKQDAKMELASRLAAAIGSVLTPTKSDSPRGHPGVAGSPGVGGASISIGASPLAT